MLEWLLATQIGTAWVAPGLTLRLQGVSFKCKKHDFGIQGPHFAPEIGLQKSIENRTQI